MKDASPLPARPRGILVVDDDPTIRLLIGSVLEDAGYTVFRASDGQEALRYFDSETVDCIVSDVNMPQMSGFDLCAAVRSRQAGRRVVILFLTGLNDYDSIKRAYDVGADDFALKQSNPALLVERVRFLLRTQQMQDDLRSSEQRLTNAQRLANIGHWECDRNGETIAASPTIAEMFGLPEGTAVSWKRLLQLSHPLDVAEMRRTMQKAMAARGSFTLEHRLVSDGGQMRILRHVGEVGTDTQNETVVRSTIQDVTATRAQDERIRFLAFHDPLTALPNRDSLQEQLDRALVRNTYGKTHVAVLAITVDDFEKVAGSLGRKTADAVLKTIGDRLREELRDKESTLAGGSRAAEGVVARGDGDGFLCFVPGLVLGDAAIAVAERLQRMVQNPLKLGDMDLRLSASIGVSLSPGDGHSGGELLDSAIAALLQGRGTKGSLTFFASDISRRARERLSLETQLRTALEQRQFELHFQPRLRTADKRLAGMEALVRWLHPRRGLVMPGEFIQVMEDSGLVTQLGGLVIDLAVRQAAHWHRSFGKPFRLSFNLSPRHFAQSDPVREVDDAVARHGASYENLEVELTESSLMEEPRRITRTLQAFRERGVRIALDDFGTGYSSLNYLRSLPLDILKIDRSFVSEIGSVRTGSPLVRAILSMADALQLTCVAEGIETRSQLDFLTKLGCPEAQGYLIARPMSAESLGAWVAERTAQAAAMARRA